MTLPKKPGFITSSTSSTPLFAAIVGHYQSLREAGVLSARLTRLYQAFAQEVQSEFNEEFLMILHEIESEDWNRFGKVRQQWEKHLRDPDDVFIHAAERRAELKKAARKKAKRKEEKSGRKLRQKS